MVRMLPDTSHHLMSSVIEAYAILLQNLNESVRDLLTALGCVILHMIALAVFPIDCLLATFYSIVTSLMGVTPRPKVDMNSLCEATGLDSNEEGTVNEQGSINEVGAISADASFADIPNGASRSATAIKLDGHTHIIPADLPPAIPLHLADCEFYYNTVDLNDVEDPNVLLEGSLQVARVTIDGQCLTCNAGYANNMLLNLEHTRYVDSGGGEMVQVSESKRAQLELGKRVYVGPAEWLLRVLKQET